MVFSCTGSGMVHTTAPHPQAREQVGVAMLAEAKDHGSADIKGVAITLEAASRTTGDQIALRTRVFAPLRPIARR